MSGYGLALPFDRDSEDFALGVEIGRLWEQLKNPEPFTQGIHAQNVEMVMRMMEATDREMRIEDLDDEWCELIVEGQSA